MRILRLLTFVIAAVGVLAPSQAFAQVDSPTSPSQPTLTLNMPSAAPTFNPGTFAPPKPPATTARRRTGQDDQGFGFMVAGGYVNSQTWGGEEGAFPSAAFEGSANGYFFGVIAGGNKNGWFGVGFNAFYIVKKGHDFELIDIDDEFQANGDLEQQLLQIAVFGRVNFMGRDSKKSPTLYVIFGGFLDILLTSKLNDIDVKDYFNGFQVGPNFGIGFEAARIGVELRFDWSMLALNSTGEGTFLNGLEGTKDFKTMLIFFFRIN